MPDNARRPVSAWTRGAVVFVSLLAGGCSADEVHVDSPEVDDSTRTACEKFLAELPETLVDRRRRTIEPEDALGAAWGDPPIVVRCGVPEPKGFDRSSACDEVNGVGWFAPADQVVDQDRTAVLTTIGIEPRVEVRVPAALRPPADALAALAHPIKATLSRVENCV